MTVFVLFVKIFASYLSSKKWRLCQHPCCQQGHKNLELGHDWVLYIPLLTKKLRRMHSASLSKVREPCLVVLLPTKLLIASQIFVRPQLSQFWGQSVTVGSVGKVCFSSLILLPQMCAYITQILSQIRSTLLDYCAKTTHWKLKPEPRPGKPESRRIRWHLVECP